MMNWMIYHFAKEVIRCHMKQKYRTIIGALAGVQGVMAKTNYMAMRKTVQNAGLKYGLMESSTEKIILSLLRKRKKMTD